jgi:hypothetical protein
VPAATRIGDADVTHCSAPARAVGSPTVFVNNIAWSRQGDNNTHLVHHMQHQLQRVHRLSLSTTKVRVELEMVSVAALLLLLAVPTCLREVSHG